MQLGSTLHRITDVMKIGIRQITDFLRQSQTGMNYKPVHPFFLKGKHLPVQLFFSKIIIPEPEGNGCEFLRRLQKFFLKIFQHDFSSFILVFYNSFL